MTATQAETDAGLQLGVLVQIQASLENLDERQRVERRERSDLLQAIYPVEIPPQSKTVASNAVNIASAELLGPRNGWVWDVRRVSITGLKDNTESVNIYRVSSTDSSAAVNANFIATVVGPIGTFSPGLGALWLRANQSIMVAGGTALGTGGTSLTNGETIMLTADAVQIDARWVGAYLL